MTDQATEAPAAEGADTSAQAENTAARRGRPRPESTIERDNKVFEALAEPATRKDLVEKTGLAKNEVYLSLYRLRRDNRIERSRDGSAHTWARVAAAAE
jgi:hypothetical protein